VDIGLKEIVSNALPGLAMTTPGWRMESMNAVRRQIAHTAIPVKRRGLAASRTKRGKLVHFELSRIAGTPPSALSEILSVLGLAVRLELGR